MFEPCEHNRKSGRIKVEGRTFQIDFWEEDHFGFPYVRVSEVVEKDVRAHLFSRKTVRKEVLNEIRECWTEQNRLAMGMEIIKQHLQREKDVSEELQQILAFCKVGGSDGD